MDEQIIELYAHVTRTACLRMTPQHLAALQSSLDQTTCLSARLQWDRKATAHAEMFNMLADAVAEALPSSLLSSATGRVHDLMITVGPAADGIALNARRRLLALIRAGDADGAAEEIERHLRVLSFMGRLASCSSTTRNSPLMSWHSLAISDSALQGRVAAARGDGVWLTADHDLEG
jgi:DNA-binding FadR family transcriptional regulator